VRTHQKFQKNPKVFIPKSADMMHLKNLSFSLVRKLSALDKTHSHLTADVFLWTTPNTFRFTNSQVNNVRCDTIQVTLKPAKLAVIALMKSHKMFCLFMISCNPHAPNKNRSNYQFIAL